MAYLSWLCLLLAWFLDVGSAQDCRFYQYIPPNGQVYTVSSPNFPASYPRGANCVWYLYTDEGQTLALNCHTVNLETNFGGWSCRDTLSVYYTNYDGSYCRRFTSESLDRKMMITFQSGYTSSGGNFACSVQVPRQNTCDCGWSFRTRIVGGTETQPNEFPSMAALVDARRRAEVCGSTIISPRYVLTAAHCLAVLSVPTTGVLVGEHDFTTGAETPATKLYRVRRFVPHPRWNSRLVQNDIALVETADPIQFSARVGPACLPFNRPNVPQLGEELTVLGWGTTSFGGPTSDVLLKAGIRVVPMEGCQATFNTTPPNPVAQICTFQRGKDACQMDSGGPLLSANPQALRWFLAGIVSYGRFCGGDDPSVNTRVYNYLDWIVSIVGDDQFCKK